MWVQASNAVNLSFNLDNTRPDGTTQSRSCGRQATDLLQSLRVISTTPTLLLPSTSSGGFTGRWERLHPIAVGTADVTGIDIRCACLAPINGIVPDPTVSHWRTQRQSLLAVLGVGTAADGTYSLPVMRATTTATSRSEWDHYVDGCYSRWPFVTGTDRSHANDRQCLPVRPCRLCAKSAALPLARTAGPLEGDKAKRTVAGP